jgi:hypothetical protein
MPYVWIALTRHERLMSAYDMILEVEWWSHVSQDDAPKAVCDEDQRSLL